MFPRRVTYSFLFLFLSLSLFAQRHERKDSLVRLLGCDQLQQIEKGGNSYRKALGHVRFEHNATFLLCDTALWNVNRGIINAIGHVKIIQNRTVLSSEKLDYYIDDNLAQFRGPVVQLQDKDKNTLRTRILDYNTKDSVATFIQGGAFRDKDGQIIESDEGTYDSKIKKFSFLRNVNMYTDSVYIMTRSLDYNTGTSIAVFTDNTHAWRDNNMLSSNAGWYDHKSEVFTFTKDVHVMTEKQEAWSDTLIYYRTPNNAEMFGNVELLDPGRELAAVAGYMQYIDSSQYIRMTRDPAVIAVTTENDVKDTVYIGGDVLIYWTVPRYKVPENEVAKSEARLKDIGVDPITEYRRKAAEAARAAAEAAMKKLAEEDPNAAAAMNQGRNNRGPMLPAAWEMEQEYDFPQVPDSLKTAPADTLPALDTLSVPDTLSQQPLDTTRIGFLLGLKNVKVFRKDMQVCCDSLAYNDLDSLVRMYRNPIVWNEVKRQYSADSISVVIKNRAIDKASLMSNAFIIFQEDSICFDQIKGTEMMAYFDTTGGLKRFDSMGGSSGVFFIEENGTLATVNKFEAKMLTATFRDGNLYDLNYFDEVKSDAYPLVQLRKDERLLKGFEWQPEKRPRGPEDVTSYVPRESERSRYERIKRPAFKETEAYFPGYMASVEKELRLARLKKQEQREKRRLEEEMKQEEQEEQVKEESQGQISQDQIIQEDKKEQVTEQKPAIPAEAPAQADTLVLEKEQIDSLLAGNTIEALKARLPVDPKAEIKARQKAERDARKAEKDKARQAKISKKEAKWAALDARDAEKAAKKEAKRKEKQRIKMEKMLKARAEREAKEQKIFDRYKEKYEKKKSKL